LNESPCKHAKGIVLSKPSLLDIQSNSIRWIQSIKEGLGNAMASRKTTVTMSMVKRPCQHHQARIKAGKNIK
jgi:hypothetical protein